MKEWLVESDQPFFFLFSKKICSVYLKTSLISDRNSL